MPSQSYPDQVLLPPPDGKPAAHLIFFIPGNPGLVAYYSKFLRTLHDRVNESHPDQPTAIVGRSLAGFELGTPADGKPSRLHSLEEQVVFVRDSIAASVQSLEKADTKVPFPITIVAHSLGAYLALRTIQDALRAQPGKPEAYRIAAAVPLFPAVNDIHKSSNARAVAWYPVIPGLDTLLPLLGNTLIWAVPDAVLLRLLTLRLGVADVNDGSEAGEATKVTLAWLRSATGVSESLFLGKQEMLTIREDRWDEALWGAQGAGAPRLFFYFGVNDGWVADESRDALIRHRAYRTVEGQVVDKKRWEVDTRPWMEIDTGGVPHSFCIGFSKVIAEKVAGFMAQVLD